MEKYKPIGEPLSYWCEECDNQVVQSEHPETGTFFTVTGTVINDKGAYHVVVFALCPECISELAITLFIDTKTNT